ncbi:unnamed protein product [Fraxinus pennsylvanica]|uniref:PPIase cyclophilin-type domain-containing protein n=1 Tax=Fraxinus pennsylvanica TaxID=56036 RepID=A0AAD2DLL2_9LAMI|nr:unnamed protein product [Fraxinus pennsylvanica]
MAAVCDLSESGRELEYHNGRRVSFWFDNWLCMKPLINQITRPIPSISHEWHVIDVLNGDSWDFRLLSNCLPTEVLDDLNLCCLPRDELEDDIQIWNLAGNGQFSLALAYLALLDLGFSDDHGYWDLAWQWQGPQRIRAFLWLCMHNKLFTNYDRNRRHLTNDSSCHVCHNGVESIFHVLRDWLLTKALWLKFLPRSNNAKFFDLNLKDWMVCNLRNSFTARENLEWRMLFGFACWYIWKWRNNLVFNKARVDCSLKPKIILHAVHACVAAFDALATVGEVNAVRREALISWIRRSMEAWKNGWRKVQVQVDNSVVAWIFNKNSLKSIQNGNLISRVQMLLYQDWQVQILLVYREANTIADHMTNLAFVQIDRFIWTAVNAQLVKSRFTTGAASGSFTSTSFDPVTKHEYEYTMVEKNPKKKGYIRLQMTHGDLNIELHCDITPRTCENFITLCECGYYNGVAFHRNIRNFMLQGGDPTGTGIGGESTWGKPFKDELNSKLLHSGRGIHWKKSLLMMMTDLWKRLRLSVQMSMSIRTQNQMKRRRKREKEKANYEKNAEDEENDKIGSWYSNPVTGATGTPAVGDGVRKYLKARIGQVSSTTALDSDMPTVSTVKKR